MAPQKMITTSIKNTDNEIIAVRKCSEPEEKAKTIYKALGYVEKPFVRRKFVVPQMIRKKSQQQNNENFTDG